MPRPERVRRGQRATRAGSIGLRPASRSSDVVCGPAAEVADIRRAASRKKFPVLDDVPGGSKLIGVFGFLGRYKGFDTVVKALHHLPKDYHLLIFGGVHPNEIKLHQPIDPVVSTLFDAGYV